jgi:predicted HAD superfamily hydrolase
MPGFLSRLPFPELYMLETKGLFGLSALAKDLSIVNAKEPSEESLDLIKCLQNDALDFITFNTPFSRSQLDPLGKFNKLILLPLQVNEQFAFKVDSGYGTQMEMLLDVLNSTPENIGVVVTQYVTQSISDKVLTERKASALMEAHPNLIYLKEFDEIDNVSQYLMPLVDALVSFSSSLGVQSLLWNKPFISLGQSHLNNISDFNGVFEYVKALSSNKVPTNKELDNKNVYILSWILSYNQPLATEVLRNKDFLYDWLEVVVSGSELPNFFDMVNGYKEIFLSSVKKDRALQVLDSGLSSPGTTISRDFQSKLNSLKPDVISFDIFDTLVDRIVEQPSHVFRLIEEKVLNCTSGKLPSFTSARQGSERALREALKENPSGEQEITLDEIYEHLKEQYSLSDGEVDAVKTLEVEEEYKCLKRRDSGYKLFNIAVNSGAEVMLISDMYLPEKVIRTILENAGYPNTIKLYLSSNLKSRKHEGRLFDVVKKIENIKPSKWLHVGDNPHGDIKIPASKKINTFRIKSAFHLIRENKKLEPLLKKTQRNRSHAESVIFGLSQKRFFDDVDSRPSNITHFGGVHFKFGYMGAGPMFFGFLNWTINKAKEDGLDTLLFLSRDGKILYQMAKELYPDIDIRIEYAYSSRRSARVASLTNEGDISQLIDSSLQKTTVEDFFKKKFGITLSESDNDTANLFGFETIFQSVVASDRASLRQLALHLKDVILENSRKERELLIEYYGSLGVSDKNKVGLVDIGYAGTMQVSLEKIMGIKNVHGYYYMTFDSALENKPKTGPMRGYAGEFVSPSNSSNLLCRNGFFYETIFCSSDSSFICFKEIDGYVFPVFDVNDSDIVRKMAIEKIHLGSVALAKDIKHNFGHVLNGLHIDSETSSALLNDMLRNPSGLDSGMFEGCVFDDSFSGSAVRYIVPPREMILSDKNNSELGIWKQGSSVFSRRPDLAKGVDKKPIARTPNNKNSQLITKDLVSAKNSFKKSSRVIETFLVKTFTARSSRKLAKYEINRAAFFRDSNVKILKLYWKFVG